MATKNRRVATYLPPHIDEQFKAFQSERDLKNESQAILIIISEYLGVAHSVASNESYQEIQERLQRVEEKLQRCVDSELLGSSLEGLKNHIQQLESQIEELSFIKSDGSLGIGQLAKRLNMPSSTLSHWKGSNPRRCKTPEEMLKSTREKDPDGIGWSFDPQIGKFKPEKKLPGSSPSMFQGKLIED